MPKEFELEQKDVDVELIVHYDDTPVRGNVLASGNDAEDKEAEDEVLRRLDNGDVWAWACVQVKVTYQGISESVFLGGCSYENENAFRKDGYYQDMVNEALGELNHRLRQGPPITLPAILEKEWFGEPKQPTGHKGPTHYKIRLDGETKWRRLHWIRRTDNTIGYYVTYRSKVFPVTMDMLPETR